jgi:hypothetical protein
MRNQIDHVRADRRRGFCELTTTQAEFRITSEPSGRGQVEPRAIKQPFRQQSSRDRKAEQFEVVAVGDLERLGRIRERQVADRTDLFLTALRGTPHSFEMEIDKSRSSVLVAMCEARRSTVCRVAVTSDSWIGAASVLQIAP